MAWPMLFGGVEPAKQAVTRETPTARTGKSSRYLSPRNGEPRTKKTQEVDEKTMAPRLGSHRISAHLVRSAEQTPVCAGDRTSGVGKVQSAITGVCAI